MMPRLLQEWVTAQAAVRPDARAVVGGADAVTYEQLDSLSNRLARLLRERGCGKGDRVALLMPKSPMAIVALLGIYKADAVYVPLDPSSPIERLKKILGSCDNRWVLAAGPVTTVLAELLEEPRWRETLSVGWLHDPIAAGSTFPIDLALDDLLDVDPGPVESLNGPDDPAHILFTSGSTGTPKGVVITHGSVIRFVEWATRYFGIEPSDRLSAHAPLHFDLSFLDIFGAAAVGAEIRLVPPELNVLPRKLVEFIRRSELTQWFSVPSILTYLAKFDVVAIDDFPKLRRLLWAGEVLPTPTLIYWMKRLPHVRFTNLYGPTETTTASSYYSVPACPGDSRAAIPIGSACEGEELLVLDESLLPARHGETGDLFIGGAGLARGYWRDPERTAAAFIPHPQRPAERIYRTGDVGRIGDDGLVYFVGRKDSQIKSRGYRIELGEIEAALNAVDGVQSCAVVPLPTDSFEGTVICCAYQAANGFELSPAVLRRALSRRVPAYMLPARWLAFDELPSNANGKIDRRRLQEVFREGSGAYAAQTARVV
jgi:amino acid adenylation domain-containing protein